MPTTKMIKQAIFCCTKCNFESQSLHETQQHEKRHEQATCEHKRRAFNLRAVEDGDGIVIIECVCEDCLFEAYVELYREEDLGEVFSLLSGEDNFQSAEKASQAEQDRKEAICKDFEKKYGRPMNEAERAMFFDDKEINHGSL